MSKVLHRVKPNSHADSGSSWSDIELAYDGDLETYAVASMPAGSYSSQLYLYHDAIPCKYIDVAAYPVGTLRLLAHYQQSVGLTPRWETVVSSASYSGIDMQHFPIGGSIPTVAMVDGVIIQLKRSDYTNYLLLELELIEEREEITKLDIIKNVARNLRDLAFDGKVTSATNQATYGELVCDEFAFKSDSSLEGGKLWVPEPYATLGIPFGLVNGTEYLIKTYATIDHKIYSIPAFTDVPTANDNLLIFKKHKKVEYDDIFSQVFSRLRQRTLENVDASIAVSSINYLYDVLGGMDYIHSVELFATGATLPLTFTNWSVDGGMLKLGTLLDPSSYPTLRVMGQRHPVLPSLDIATLGVPQLEDVVVERMTEYMARRDIYGADKDFANIVEGAKASADILEAYLVPRFKPNSVRVR